MPYHIKKTSIITVSDVYYKGGDDWTDIYADRKQYSSKSDADAMKATTITMNGITYAPKTWANSTVVTE